MDSPPPPPLPPEQPPIPPSGTPLSRLPPPSVSTDPDIPTLRYRRPVFKKVALSSVISIAVLGFAATATFLGFTLSDNNQSVSSSSPTVTAKSDEEGPSATDPSLDSESSESSGNMNEKSEAPDEPLFQDPYDGLTGDSLKDAISSDLGCVDIGISTQAYSDNFTSVSFNCFYEEPEPLASVGDVEGIYVPIGGDSEELADWLADHDSPWECVASSNLVLCSKNEEDLDRAVAGRPQM